jgi:hypothetical protein
VAATILGSHADCYSKYKSQRLVIVIISNPQNGSFLTLGFSPRSKTTRPIVYSVIIISTIGNKYLDPSHPNYSISNIDISNSILKSKRDLPGQSFAHFVLWESGLSCKTAVTSEIGGLSHVVIK